MNKLTLIQTYYNEPEDLQRCIDQWNHITSDIEIILVDDGSIKLPAADVIAKNKIRDNISFSLYRVTEDIGFNSHGCRNLAAKVAEGDWLLFIDIDHTINPGDVDKLVNDTVLESYSWYKLNTYYRDPAKKSLTLNQYVVDPTLYWDAGGYNESYVRFHMGDREFLQKLEDLSPEKVLDSFTIQCHRGGRKGIIDETLRGPVYDNEKMVFYTARFDKEKIVQIETILNFEWEKLI